MSLADLPIRTWPQWWRELPRYWRIGAWTVLALSVVNLAIVIRCCIGWIEDPEITAFESRGIFVGYWWGSPGARGWFPGEFRLRSGIYGNSCANVYEIWLREKGTDADLKLIGERFPNLKQLLADQSGVTVEGMKALRACRKLRNVSFNDTDLDDRAVEILAELIDLERIELDGTLVTDASVPLFAAMRHLDFAAVSSTNITGQPGSDSLPKQIRPCYLVSDDCVIGTIVWSDGVHSGRFPGPYEIRVERLDGNGTSDTPIEKYDFLTRSSLHWSGLTYHDDDETYSVHYDGHYCFHVKLGGYEATPVVVEFVKGYPTTHHIEFQMPVTKAEALRSVGR